MNSLLQLMLPRKLCLTVAGLAMVMYSSVPVSGGMVRQAPYTMLLHYEQFTTVNVTKETVLDCSWIGHGDVQFSSGINVTTL